MLSRTQREVRIIVQNLALVAPGPKLFRIVMHVQRDLAAASSLKPPPPACKQSLPAASLSMKLLVNHSNGWTSPLRGAAADSGTPMAVGQGGGV